MKTVICLIVALFLVACGGSTKPHDTTMNETAVVEPIPVTMAGDTIAIK